jgi:hypothetical protein
MGEDEYRAQLLAAGHSEEEADALIVLKKAAQGTPEEQDQIFLDALEKATNPYDGMFVHIDIPPQPEDELAHNIEKFGVPEHMLGLPGRSIDTVDRTPSERKHINRLYVEYLYGDNKEKDMIPDIETDALITAIAIACHNANKKHCESIGDNSQKSWSETPENIRASAIDGVSKWWVGDILTPEQSHESWMAFKKADGFVYGEVKDLEKKTHPCMVPYGDLPEEQRIKDDIFMSTVFACMDAFGVERPS